MKHTYYHLASYFVAALFSLNVKAQTKTPEIKVYMPKDSIKQEPQKALQIGQSKDFHLYALPQDRMGCLVPKNKNMDSMNAHEKMDSYAAKDRIPNASQLHQVIPSAAPVSMAVKGFAYNNKQP